jgi:hypothetical protein
MNSFGTRGSVMGKVQLDINHKLRVFNQAELTGNVAKPGGILDLAVIHFTLEYDITEPQLNSNEEHFFEKKIWFLKA